MPTPTEPGYYWADVARIDGPIWRVLEVFRVGGALVWMTCDGRCRGVEVLDTWGSRIPSSARLEAMEEMVLESPICAIEGDAQPICHFCFGESPDGGVLRPLHHDAACPWPRAQEKPE